MVEIGLNAVRYYIYLNALRNISVVKPNHKNIVYKTILDTTMGNGSVPPLLGIAQNSKHWIHSTFAWHYPKQQAYRESF